MYNTMTKGEGEALEQICQGMQNHQVGKKLNYILTQINGIGTQVFLDPANGDDGNDGFSPFSAKKTFAAAYALLTANKNDILYLIGNNASLTLPAKILWNKDYTHLIGVCAPVALGKRARIFQAAALTGVDPLIDVQASGCMFANFQAMQGVNDATNKVCFRVKDCGRNYFYNVHFAGIEHATMDVAGASSLKLDNAEECTFEECQIGLDTISRAQNSTELWIDNTTRRIKFKNCKIYAYISNAGHALVTIEDGTAIDRTIEFENPEFLTDSLNQGVSCTSIFNIKAAITQGKIIIKNPILVTDGASGTGEWDSNNRGIIWVFAPACVAAGAGGVATKQ